MELNDLKISLQTLLREQRTGFLATLSNRGVPYVSMAPFVVDAENANLIIHISELAAHTRYLLQRPEAAFMICQSEQVGVPVHNLPRVSFQILAHHPVRESDEWLRIKEAYLQRFPSMSSMTMGLKDFHFFSLEILRVRQIAGFGLAKTLKADDVRAWLLS